MAAALIQVVFFLIVPAVALWLERRFRPAELLGSVALCYLIGIVLANIPGVPLDGKVAMEVSTAAVALAIPLLLFSLDFMGWLRLAPRTVLAFVWVIVAVCVASAAAVPIFADRLDDAGHVAARGRVPRSAKPGRHPRDGGQAAHEVPVVAGDRRGADPHEHFALARLRRLDLAELEHLLRRTVPLLDDRPHGSFPSASRPAATATDPPCRQTS